MIFNDVSEERLTEMKSRLMMEGIFNREKAMAELAQKMFGVIEDVEHTLWQARQLALHVDDILTDEQKKTITDKCPDLPDDCITNSGLTTDFWNAHALCKDVKQELQQIIIEMV